MGKCGPFLHDAEEMVLKLTVDVKTTGRSSAFLLAVSIEETDASKPIATFGVSRKR